jgi:hypothetical protein
MWKCGDMIDLSIRIVENIAPDEIYNLRPRVFPSPGSSRNRITFPYWETGVTGEGMLEGL